MGIIAVTASAKTMTHDSAEQGSEEKRREGDKRHNRARHGGYLLWGKATGAG